MDSLGTGIFLGFVIFTFVPTFVVSFLISFFVVRGRLRRRAQQMQGWHLASIFIFSILIGIIVTVGVIFIQFKLDENEVRTESFYPCKWVLCIGNIIQPYSTKESEALIPKLDFDIYQAKSIKLYGKTFKIAFFEISEDPVTHMIYSKSGYAAGDSGFEITQIKFNEGLIQDANHYLAPDGTDVWKAKDGGFIYKKNDTAIKVSGATPWDDKINDNMITVMKSLQKTNPEDLVLVSRSQAAREKEKDDAARRYRQNQQDDNPAPVYIIK